jgi:hypothetical protein
MSDTIKLSSALSTNTSTNWSFFEDPKMIQQALGLFEKAITIAQSRQSSPQQMQPKRLQGYTPIQQASPEPAAQDEKQTKLTTGGNMRINEQELDKQFNQFIAQLEYEMRQGTTLKSDTKLCDFIATLKVAYPLQIRGQMIQQLNDNIDKLVVK